MHGAQSFNLLSYYLLFAQRFINVDNEEMCLDILPFPERLFPRRTKYIRQGILWAAFALFCFSRLYRIIYKQEFFVWRARHCMFTKTKFLDDADDDEFLNWMWSVMPNIVNICSFATLSDSIDMFHYNGSEVLFLTELVTDEEHHCDLLFLTDYGEMAIPKAMARNYNTCMVHSSSDTHPPMRLQRHSPVKTYPFKISPRGGLKTDLFEDITAEEYSDVSLVTLMSFFIRRYRVSSIVINMKNANEFVPLFFTSGIFQESSLVTCQINIAYPKPRNDAEITQFRIAWLRLLKDRK
ncbi:unnamed protein product [Nippostrongylus brasiliensis]|uniref:Transmembrane protein 231 n=1 Tax=Nippostrongylus brasiliensis TaxID=27835 RepID=A0A0N4YMA0_NIPBR|nr:unnamed protein product [Nippostrongylus brasiliensis]